MMSSRPKEKDCFVVGGSKSGLCVFEILVTQTEALRVSNTVKQPLRKESEAEHYKLKA